MNPPDDYEAAWTEGMRHGLAQCNHHHNEPIIDMENCDRAFREIAPEWYAVMPQRTIERLMDGILDAALGIPNEQAGD